MSATRSRVAAVLLGTLLLAGCAAPPGFSPSSAPQPPARMPELAAFSADLRGRDAVPASPSAGQGQLVAVLNRNTGLLRWKLSFSGLSGPVQGAAFHSPGMSGELAPVVLRMGRTVLSPSEGRAVLTPRQRADLLAGQWYVNLPTARYPDGELRGQLVEQRR
ncbi:MAG TPA: CHRD domain-containing protein [Ottowia sp.]|uniref:CHRD domain-containing protein n=1 Tax=Ottowia sp. TaxID=1898956 RepID=UPI002B7DCBE1|nr:CHRD domain-containing protein [Ottowia sp.]HMN21428.1 CHRD domain-containing protein [Ottowia sp.]